MIGRATPLWLLVLAVTGCVGADERLLVPIPGALAPTKAIGMVANYPPRPGTPVTQSAPGFFIRSAGALAGDGDDIPLPRGLPRVLYEAELVVVIGKRAAKVSPEEAAACILGYTCGMDGSPEVLLSGGDRDHVRSLAGKSADGIAPIGPRIVKNIDFERCEILLRVNGEVIERSQPKDLVWSPTRLVSEISQTVALEPGDVVFTGATRAVPHLKAGDRVEVEISGLGTLRNRVVEAH